jgi:hypothetical protein
MVPVRCGFGPKAVITNTGAHVKDGTGKITWVYNQKQVTGKGIYVCGCARSGTLYIVEVLKALGYEIGHEIADTDGSCGYHLVIVRPENCFHQVRHPLNQIASMGTQQHWGFADRHVEIHNHGILGCMQYWLAWNELCEEFCVWRYRIEDLPWPEFLERIGHKQVLIPDISKTTNSRPHKELTWPDLFNTNRDLAKKIKDKTIEYGYSFPKGQNEYKESQVAVAV